MWSAQASCVKMAKLKKKSGEILREEEKTQKKSSDECSKWIKSNKPMQNIFTGDVLVIYLVCIMS